MCALILLLTIISATIDHVAAQVPMTQGGANNADFAVGTMTYNGEYYGRAYSDSDQRNFNRLITIPHPAGFVSSVGFVFSGNPLHIVTIQTSRLILDQSKVDYPFRMYNYVWLYEINSASTSYQFFFSHYYFIQQISYNYLLISPKYRNNYIYLVPIDRYIGFNLTQPYTL